VLVWPSGRRGVRSVARSAVRAERQPTLPAGVDGDAWPVGAQAGPRRRPSVRPGGTLGWAVVARLVGRGRRDEGHGRALELVEALTTQVRAGASPEAAWRQAHEVVWGSVPADAVGAVGDPGGPPLGGGDPTRDPAWRALGAAWRMSEQTGAPLADVLDRLAVSLRQEAEVDAEVEASLAAPRATARLLAGLPLVGVALGELIGAHPVAVLIGTPVGRTCALCGALLAVAGQLWTRALVGRVLRSARAG